MADISIVIVSYNTVDYLRECLNSVYQFTLPAPEVVVVDNASSDASCEMVKREFPLVKLIESKENLGFGLANNLGAEAASHPYIMLLNSDAILKVNTAHCLLQYLQVHPEVKCVTPRVVLPKTETIQAKTFGYAPNLQRVLMQSTGLNRLFPKSHFFSGIDGDYRWAREMQVGWVSGVCMLMRTEEFLAVGGFDARFFMYCEDVELCMKLSRLGKIVLIDDYPVIHYGGASSKTVAAKVRNSVWQQRHLLIILQDYDGEFKALLARILMVIGMLFRMLAGVLKIPKNGLKQNEGLLSAWARFKELIGLNALAKVAK